MATTIETVTRRQIRALHEESAASGDYLMCETCDMALAHWSDQPPTGEERRVIASALLDCVRVLAEEEEAHSCAVRG